MNKQITAAEQKVIETFNAFKAARIANSAMSDGWTSEVKKLWAISIEAKYELKELQAKFESEVAA